jgi:hypothetical protein
MADGEPLSRDVWHRRDGRKRRAYIPAFILKDRLPEALRAVQLRERVVYEQTDPAAVEPVLRSYRDFVALCARMEAETGSPCLIIASY